MHGEALPDRQVLLIARRHSLTFYGTEKKNVQGASINQRLRRESTEIRFKVRFATPSPHLHVMRSGMLGIRNNAFTFSLSVQQCAPFT